MALRLTGTASADQPPREIVAELHARGEAAVRAGDLDAYRAQWAQAAGLDDAHRRHQAHVLLAEAGLVAAGAAAPARIPHIFLSVAQELATALEAEPREPLLVNYLGVACYELWSLEAAEACFAAARRLDPELPHVAQNLDELRRRRRVAGGGPKLPPVVALPLAEVARRALAVAARAVPATGLSLSLAMIVKDEEEMLPRCLAAIAPAVDEIVIVDTGSTDRTVEIAESFGARVLHHEWDGDFAAARNVAFDAATGDWVMYLDADEVLVEADRDELRALTGRVWREAFYLVERNFTGEEDDGTSVVHNALRVFRNRPAYRFTGRLHEQIADKLPGFLPDRLESTRVRVEHYGYLRVVRDAKDKLERNISILRRQLEETAEPTPFMRYNLGAELSAIGDWEGAHAEFVAAWSALRDDPQLPTYGFAPALASRMVRAQRITGRLGEAMATSGEALAVFPGFTDLVLEQGFVADLQGRPEVAIQRFLQCIEMGEPPARYTSVAGSGTYLPLQAMAMIHRQRGELDEAEALLTRVLREHPRYLGSVDPLAGVLLANGLAPARVVERITAGVAELTPSVRFVLGTALYEAGAAKEAAPQFAAVLDRQPGSTVARLALAEADLTLARFDSAAATAAGVPDDDPAVVAARRTELFARLAGEDLDGARAALPRVNDPADRELFAAWLLVASGEEPPRTLPAETVPFLATALEALLRVEAFESFERLLPLLACAGLPPRESHELLAGIYLRRGYLESAGDEWIAACAEAGGPDVRALVGLAQVAAARGLPEDAVVFAESARELDPSHPAPERLLAALAAA